MGDLLEVLAVAAHGGAIVIHGLGFTYNMVHAKRLDRDGAIHAAALVFSIVSLRKHARQLRSWKSAY